MNARLVLPDGVRESDLLIHEGRIDAIGSGARRDAPCIDCDGDYVLAGFVELHTDRVEHYVEPRPGEFAAVHQAVLTYDAELAACGITTAFDAVTLGGEVGGEHRQQASIAAIRALNSRAVQAHLRIEHHLHARCELTSPNLLEYLQAVSAHAPPRIVSLMDHTPGRGQWRDLRLFREHYGKRYGITDAEIDATIVRRRRARDQFAHSSRDYVVAFAHRSGAVLAGHDPVDEADVNEMVKAGCVIAEFPTSLIAAFAARKAGMQVVAGAPNLVRGGSHSGNIAAVELIGRGLADVLSSDYDTSSLLNGVWLLAERMRLPLNAASRMVSEAPAKAAGFRDRGTIAEGQRADLIRVRVRDGNPVVISTWCRGRQVHCDTRHAAEVRAQLS